MKKLLLVLLLSGFAFVPMAFSCSTFLLHKNGQLAFGKNYDWVTGTGQVHTNLRGLQKTSLPPDYTKLLHWVSTYGSVTFNQYGKEFPNGGMNEKGLVVELMWLTASEYPRADNRSALSVLQWIQYQLDNCATVEEVLATDTILRVVSTGTPQHYLVADAKGNAATVEFINGRMVVHKGNQLVYPVLTNTPYSTSLKALKTAGTPSNPGAFNDNSVARFAKACTMVQDYQQAHTNQSIVDYSFNILTSVAAGSFTRWTIVYDITNQTIHFKTADKPAVKSFKLNAFDYSCAAQPMSFDLNNAATGNINTAFIPYSSETNTRLLNQAFKESAGPVNVPNALQAGVVAVAAASRCR